MNCLVDSSAWIRHFKRKDNDLVALLDAQFAFTHPMVIGELALGNIREAVISDIRQLPILDVYSHEEVLSFVFKNSLQSKGLGYVDVHLLYSALVNKVNLLSYDKALVRELERLRRY